MDSTTLDAAVNELLKMPGYCESEILTLEKVTLRDGREALIRMEITTDEDELEDFEIWVPNAELCGVRSTSERAPGSALTDKGN